MIKIDSIYCADSEILLKQIDSESINCIVTDPPYGLGKNIVGDEKFKVGSCSDIEQIYWKSMEIIFKELFRVLKPKSHLIFSVSENLIWPFRPFCEKIGFQFRHLLFMGDKTRFYMSRLHKWPFCWEGVFDFTKEGWSPLNNDEENGPSNLDFWIIEKETKEGRKGRKINHPTVKPEGFWLQLMKWCSKEGELVLDPFNGSGTTTWAAKVLKRHYIGIEINPEYCKLAELRLKPEMFDNQQLGIVE